MRALLFLLAGMSACASMRRWPAEEEQRYLGLDGGCYVVAYERLHAADPESCCRRALDAAERHFDSYGRWRAALEESRNASVLFDPANSSSPPMQNWYSVMLAHCKAD